MKISSVCVVFLENMNFKQLQQKIVHEHPMKEPQSMKNIGLYFGKQQKASVKKIEVKVI